MRLLTPQWPTRRALSTDLFSEMERMFEDFGRMPKMSIKGQDFVPACEISETDTQYFMSMDLPGLKKEDIKVEIDENTLTVSGERKQEKKEGDETSTQYIERYYGTFTRSFALPSAVDAEKVEARYEDGVLKLEIPKSTAAKTRKIEIQSKSGGFN